MRREPFIPAELVRDVPYITMIGDAELHIEHHHGMVSYRPEQIVFDTGCGAMTVSGSGLVVSKYTSSEAGLTGQIDAVLLREAKGDS